MNSILIVGIVLGVGFVFGEIAQKVKLPDHVRSPAKEIGSAREFGYREGDPESNRQQAGMGGPDYSPEKEIQSERYQQQLKACRGDRNRCGYNHPSLDMRCFLGRNRD